MVLPISSHCSALSTQCSAEELVKILNDLFARWEKTFFFCKDISELFWVRGVIRSPTYRTIKPRREDHLYTWRTYVYWDRTLGRIPDKNLKSFPPCYSQSPLQLCLEISNFFKLMQPLTFSTVHLLYTVKEKGGKSDRKPNPLPYGLRNPYRSLKSENSQDYGQKP